MFVTENNFKIVIKYSKIKLVVFYCAAISLLQSTFAVEFKSLKYWTITQICTLRWSSHVITTVHNNTIKRGRRRKKYYLLLVLRAKFGCCSRWKYKNVLQVMYWLHFRPDAMGKQSSGYVLDFYLSLLKSGYKVHFSSLVPNFGFLLVE